MLSDYDSEGDRLAARENARFLRDMYNDYEPECTCYCVGDRADASDCDLHNPNSRFNLQREDEPVMRIPPSRAVQLVESADDLWLDEGVG
jgi:hypothetical protein